MCLIAKKIICVLLILISGSAFLVSCDSYSSKGSYKMAIINNELDYLDFISAEELKKNNFVSMNHSYDTDVSTAFLTKDGNIVIYVYSVPIRFWNENGKMLDIDSRICETIDNNKNNGYAYTIANSDIKPYYPENLSTEKGVLLVGNNVSYDFGISGIDSEISAKYVEATNFISEETNMVLYQNAIESKSNVFLYPSPLGTNCEIHIEHRIEKSPKFWVSTDATAKLEDGGYITLTKNNESNKPEIVGLIQSPIIKEGTQRVSYGCQWAVNQVDDKKYELSLVIDPVISKKTNYTIYTSFECRREKQPDSAIYSGKPDMNSYLSNSCIIGNYEEYGNGEIMTRFNIIKKLNLNLEQVKSVSYNIYSFDSDNQFEMRSMLENWCSVTGSWSNNYKTGDVTSIINTKTHIISFDITKEFMKWFEEGRYNEAFGVKIKTINEKEGDYSVLLTNDNSLYRNKAIIYLN